MSALLLSIHGGGPGAGYGEVLGCQLLVGADGALDWDEVVRVVARH